MRKTHLDKFKEEHGRYFDAGNVWYFENGARVSGLLSGKEGYGITYHHPPEDRYELLMAKRNYLSIVLNHEKTEFDRYKNYCTTQMSHHRAGPTYCPPPPPEALGCLERGKERIANLRHRMEALEAEIAETPEARAALRSHETKSQASQELDLFTRQIASADY